MLDDVVEGLGLSRHEQIVLLVCYVTRSLSPRTDLNRPIPGERLVTQLEWQYARHTLTEKGLLGADGLLTEAGLATMRVL